MARPYIRRRYTELDRPSFRAVSGDISMIRCRTCIRLSCWSSSSRRSSKLASSRANHWGAYFCPAHQVVVVPAYTTIPRPTASTSWEVSILDNRWSYGLQLSRSLRMRLVVWGIRSSTKTSEMVGNPSNPTNYSSAPVRRQTKNVYESAQEE